MSTNLAGLPRRERLAVIQNQVHVSQVPLRELSEVRGTNPEGHVHHYLDWFLKFGPKRELTGSVYEPQPDLPVHKQLVGLAKHFVADGQRSVAFGYIVATLFPNMVRRCGAYTTDNFGYAHLGIDSRAFSDDPSGHFRIELLTNTTDNAPVSHHLWVFDSADKLIMELEPHDDVTFFRRLMEELTGRPLPEDVSIAAEA